MSSIADILEGDAYPELAHYINQYIVPDNTKEMMEEDPLLKFEKWRKKKHFTKNEGSYNYYNYSQLGMRDFKALQNPNEIVLRSYTRPSTLGNFFYEVRSTEADDDQSRPPSPFHKWFDNTFKFEERGVDSQPIKDYYQTMLDSRSLLPLAKKNSNKRKRKS